MHREALLLLGVCAIPWGQSGPAPSRLVVHLDPEPTPPASAPASRSAPIQVRLDWHAGTGQVRRSCDGLWADDATQLRQLVLAAQKARGGAPEVQLEAAGEVGAGALVRTLRELAATGLVRLAGGGRVSLTEPTPVQSQPTLISYHDAGRGTECPVAACREPQHWVLAIRGKRYHLASLPERLQFEAEQQRKPGGRDRLTLLHMDPDTPHHLLAGILAACAHSGMATVELTVAERPR